ncbi:MAG: UDP-N-acetylglucosamine 1-carboxyvinyltransferase [Clostridiales bacterium]|jgi:UDP-N-acetylglucosamine 1-carboxyvinyltransferase|nr:UDP-N-acetylglucosamine 1-carboxyvinyltransferase [Clostridiales bacterium]
MSRLIIEGLHKLDGEAVIHGAKNSVLPILAATILAGGTSEIANCPRLSDVRATSAILRYLGCSVTAQDEVVTVDPSGLCRSDIPDDLMREMRSSIVFLGAIAARMGEAHLSFPGGCELGPRPINLHLAALRRLGLVIEEERGRLNCHIRGQRLKGTTITLEQPSVGATENILLASATAEGVTVIVNAAREPEIVDLCCYLNACGARITGAGEGTITIEGVDRLGGCRHQVLPDRIETVTYMAAAAATGGRVVLSRTNPALIASVLPAFEEAGCHTDWSEASRLLTLEAPERLSRVTSVLTMPYPGFPTDAQAPVMAMTCVAQGTSVFIETIFDNRYRHVDELSRLGARIKVEGRVAVVEGVPRLSGAQVECTDLRGGAALVIAALAADGETEITALQHLDRGYDGLEEGLSNLGASIRREE